MAKIIWSSKAVSDLKQIFEYWYLRNKSNTYNKKLNRIIELKLQQISENPNSGIMTNIQNIKAILVENYYIHYSLKPDSIQILKIWDTRQNPEQFTL